MAVEMALYEVQGVQESRKLLEEMLRKAQDVKQTSTIEPPVSKAGLAELLERVDDFFLPMTPAEYKKTLIDTAAHEIFNTTLATTTIGTAEFAQIWNLLDIISLLSDDGQVEPSLVFWLVEELLDSQTIPGCRKVFDYLESRRERMVAKHFREKHLVILRSCNELLRRLSRAEDTAFCGRVFIYLFQSFPLGDRSSVNLRGEFHTENVTIFDDLSGKEPETEHMDIDISPKPQPAPSALTKDPVGVSRKMTEKEKEEAKREEEKLYCDPTPMTSDQLYPIFWSLQQSFSQPKDLLEQPTSFSKFQAGLRATMATFTTVQTQHSSRSAKTAEDSKKRTKRKREDGDDDLASAYNPKYLTNRDLFELEISDISFRRHIMLQALIVLDFLLSASVKAKQKLESASPPLVYLFKDLPSFSEEDTKWALGMKSYIAEYLKGGFEGAFFYRMVESVLTRDKNWARWKIEHCPPIGRDMITAEEYAYSSSELHPSKRRRTFFNKFSSTSMRFITDGASGHGLQKLKTPSKYALPPIKKFKSSIDGDTLDLEMASDDAEKQELLEKRASKIWRALRIATSTKLVAFDKLERSDNIDYIFQDNVKYDDSVAKDEEEASGNSIEETATPKDIRSVVISGFNSYGLVDRLVEDNPKTLGKKATYTTRVPRQGEVDGDYIFISKEEFNAMLENDTFLEHSEDGEDQYGTSRKNVEEIIAESKVPIMEMEDDSIQQLKEKAYPSRFIFIATKETHEQAEAKGLYDVIIVNEEPEATFRKLESYIFGRGENRDDACDLSDLSTDANTSTLEEVAQKEMDGVTPTGPELLTEVAEPAAS